jgi:hypothetical protein
MKCVICEKSSQELYEVQVGDDADQVCEACVEDADGPGRYEGFHGAELATLLVLERIDLDGGADEFLSDEGNGYLAAIGQYVYCVDSQGFHSYQEERDAAAAVKRLRDAEDDGFGASEDDAYVTFTTHGVEASLAGKSLGTFRTERRARAAVSVAMRKEGYFPNVFLQGEHGPSVRRIDVW